MDIKEIEVLIECKRLVEAMVKEKKHILNMMDGNGKDVRCVEKQIARMERALQGQPAVVVSYFDL